MMEALACHPLGQLRGSLPQSAKLNDPDTIKVRMQLSRRKRAPGVRITTSCKAFNLLNKAVGKTTRILYHGKRDREKGDTSRLIQRSRRRRDWHRAQDGDTLYILRVV